MSLDSEYVTQMNAEGTVAVDDMILVKDTEAKAGSRMLEGFKPLFSAEVVERLEKKGYAISGKTQVGEFGLDLVGEFSYYGEQSGKLKGAAATLVADGKVKAALGVDMNGTPRRAAALANVDFLKPTYGTVSRYGIISCASSGEQVGVYAKSTAAISEIMEVIAGHDEKDGTSLRDYTWVAGNAKGIPAGADNVTGNAEGCTAGADHSPTGMPEATVAGVHCAPVHNKVAIVKELLDLCDDETKKKVAAFAEKLNKAGIATEEISCDFFENANTAWQILMTAETCNNVSRYDGVKYGHRTSEYKNIDELYVNSRTEGFNFLTKAVILYGSDVLSKNRYEKCYGKALKVRRVISEKYAELTEKYDAILTPVCSSASFEAYDIKDAFEKVFKESIFTATANLIGVPALVSGGVQLMGKAFGEGTLLALAESTEKEA